MLDTGTKQVLLLSNRRVSVFNAAYTGNSYLSSQETGLPKSRTQLEEVSVKIFLKLWTSSVCDVQ